MAVVAAGVLALGGRPTLSGTWQQTRTITAISAGPPVEPDASEPDAGAPIDPAYGVPQPAGVCTASISWSTAPPPPPSQSTSVLQPPPPPSQRL